MNNLLRLLTAAALLLALAACGGSSDDDLVAWCDAFVGPMTLEQRAECDRARGGL